MSIGIDLRIINTHNLVVTRTVSMQKQIVGYEVGFDIFRFFGSDLFDINLGAKNMEPLQLGVRTALEQGVFELMSAVTNVNAQSCLDTIPGHKPAATAPGQAPEVQTSPIAAPGATPVTSSIASPGVVVAGGLPGPKAVNGRQAYQVLYEFGDPGLAGQATSAIERIAADAQAGKPAVIEVIARDSENWSPAKREELTGQRVRNLRDALAVRGVHPSRIQTTWKPAMSDTSIRRDGPGYQIFAIVEVKP